MAEINFLQKLQVKERKEFFVIEPGKNCKACITFRFK